MYIIQLQCLSERGEREKEREGGRERERAREREERREKESTRTGTPESLYISERETRFV